ncbi:MAG: leucine-rich repeat domain-containing protein [Anaerolineaceae bacterium]|nr:leucine-rich repeat domain-containing protein [Anaerolineaceae bacterium]
MNKIIVSILCILLFASILPVMGQNESPETFSSGDWDYIENKEGITLTKYKGSETNLEIPGELDGKTVTQLEKELFKNNMTLESVVMPNSIKSTGGNVFNGCAALKNVQLSTKLDTISGGLFRYCISLEHIMIPFSVTTIGGFAFSDCIQLKDILLLSVTSIGESAFENCMSLTDVITSGKLTSIQGRAFRYTPWLDAQTDEFVLMGKDVLVKYNGIDKEVEIPYGTTMISSAFEENYRIESVTIPETVKNIGMHAFREAINLQHVNIPEYATTIGANAFNGCRSLTEIELPEGYAFKTLGDSAFRNNTQLSKINIPSSVTKLSDGVFANCPALTDFVIPASVTTVHKNAFQNSKNVHLYVTPGTDGERFAKEFEIPFDYSLQSVDDFIIKPEEEGIQIVRYTGKLFDVEVPAEINGERVTSIGTAAFQNNDQVKRVILPLTIQSIGDWAFSYMENLAYVQINENVKKIGANVFTGSDALKEIKLPETVEEIGTEPFSSALSTICAAPDSAVSAALQTMGYSIQSYDACSPDEELLTLWAELNGAEITAETICDCSVCSEAPGESADGTLTDTVSVTGTVSASDAAASDISIIRIPDGLSELTVDLLPAEANELILIIPASVETIDEQILDGRTISIISDSGTAAESFATANGLKFLVQVNTWLGE